MKKNSSIEDYMDIIDLPHPEPKGRQRMPAVNRAAQFAPFAALSGFEDRINNTEKASLEERSL